MDLGALVRNARRVQELVRVPILPMLKADAYGLGAAAVARALEPLDPWGYGVATVAEGAALREAGINRRLLVFTPLVPGGDAGHRAHALRPVIGDPSALDAWRAGGGGPYHLEIDTGMSRSGIRWDDTPALDLVRAPAPEDGDCEGVFTHFHSADTDPDATEGQWQRFRQVLAGWSRQPPFVHAANSAACAMGPVYAGSLVRPGIYLYGGSAGALRPDPVAAFRARVAALRRVKPGDTVSYGGERVVSRETTVATLAAGYADGVPRALGHVGRVEFAWGLAPIAGRVTMDLLMADVGDAPVRTGDVATIYGGRIALDEQAAAAGTISYELLTRVTQRVPRRYGGGEPA